MLGEDALVIYREEVEVDGKKHLLDVYRVWDDPDLELTRADVEWLKKEHIALEDYGRI